MWTSYQDKMIQVDVDDQAHLKLISLIENLPLIKKWDLYLLYESILMSLLGAMKNARLWPTMAMHYLNIKSDVKPVKKQQWQFCCNILEANETEVYKLIEGGFIQEEQHPD